MMANVSRLDDENDIFRDARGVIADALEMARHQNEVDAGFDRLRIPQHVRAPNLTSATSLASAALQSCEIRCHGSGVIVGFGQ